MPAFDITDTADFDAPDFDAPDSFSVAARDDIDRWTRPKPHAKSGTPRADQQPGKRHNPRPLVSLDELAVDLDTIDFVQGVLVEGGLTVVYGDSNAGKTFWATDLALHVAAGKPWNGRRVEQGGVVYVALEGGRGFRNRAVAWRDANEDDYPPGLPFYGDFSPLNLLDPDADTGPLIETIHAASELGCPVKLVVVDTFARAMAGGNENASEDMGALVRNADRIRRETGANVLFIHHTGKDAARGARGHSSLRAALDTEIEVVADETRDVRTATVCKQRDLAKPPAFGFRLEVVALGQNQHGEPVTTCLVAPVDVMENQSTNFRPRLPEEPASLLREIENAIASGHGGDWVPEPDMPICHAIKRTILQTDLIRRGWLQVPNITAIFQCAPGMETPETPGGGGNSGNSETPQEPVPKSEHTRLWKRLNYLKLHGYIGFNRNDVWLAR